jgi:hypothetical protein
MKRLLIFATLFFFSTAILTGQQENKPEWKNRLLYGGSFSLSIGSTTFIEVSPIIGYRIIPRVSVGIGATYIYYRSVYFGNFSTNIYGGNAFATVVVIKNIGEFLHLQSSTNVFIHMEDELLSMERRFFNNPTPDAAGRFMVQNIWVGPGIKQRIGARSGIYLMVLWNLNQTMYSLYSNPTFRMGIIF